MMTCGVFVLQPSADMWRRLQMAKPPFFEHLAWMQGGEELWHAVKELEPCVLTGLPRGAWAEPQKRAWVSKHLGKNVKVHCCKSRDKKNYAATCLRFQGRDAVLIDDRPSNCSDWRSVGGTAVEHKSPGETLQKLRDIGLLVQVSSDKGCSPALSRAVLPNDLDCK